MCSQLVASFCHACSATSQSRLCGKSPMVSSAAKAKLKHLGFGEWKTQTLPPFPYGGTAHLVGVVPQQLFYDDLEQCRRDHGPKKNFGFKNRLLLSPGQHGCGIFGSMFDLGPLASHQRERSNCICYSTMTVACPCSGMSPRAKPGDA